MIISITCIIVNMFDIDTLSWARYCMIRGLLPVSGPDDFLTCYYCMTGNIDMFELTNCIRYRDIDKVDSYYTREPEDICMMNIRPDMYDIQRHTVTAPYQPPDLHDVDPIIGNAAEHMSTIYPDYAAHCLHYAVCFYLDFAKWWVACIADDKYVGSSLASATLIMNDDLSYVHKDVFCIWYPFKPSENTYRRLHSMHPELSQLIAHGCVVHNYVQLYKDLDVLPEASDLHTSKMEHNTELTTYIEQRAQTLGMWAILDHVYCTVFETKQLCPPGMMAVQSSARSISLMNAYYDINYYIPPLSICLDTNYFMMDHCDDDDVFKGVTITKLYIVNGMLRHIDSLLMSGERPNLL